MMGCQSLRVLVLALFFTNASALLARSRSTAAFVSGVRPCSAGACPLWQRQSVVREGSAASWDGAAARGGSTRPAEMKGLLAPVSKWHKFVAWVTRKEPIYSGLMQEDYVEACRSLGLREDVDYPTLQDKVMTLLNKYEGERRKKISIEWSRDKIIEHRLFEQLDGLTPRPADLDLRMLDEKNMNPTTQDEDMFLAALGLSDSDFQGSPGAVEKLLSNRAVRRFSPKRISDLIAYGIYAFKESVNYPNLKRIIFPTSISFALGMGASQAVEGTVGALIACVLAHTFPVYNRGEPEYVSRRESRPMKWNKLWLAIAFNAFATLIGFGFGRVWVALKYPTFDMQPDRFLIFMANAIQALMASGFFIKDSTLAVKPGKLGDAA